MATIDVCVHCDLPPEDHHAFEAVTIPDGCTCDPRDWGSLDDIPAICAGFVPRPRETNCGVCEHDEACHAAQPPKVGTL